MKKMSTLFRVDYEGKGRNRRTILHPEVRPENEWVIKGEGVATRKFDGTATAVIDGIFYKRYDAKAGKTPPEGAIPCIPEPDPITGHWPHWVKLTFGSEDKFIMEALFNAIHERLVKLIQTGDAKFKNQMPDGTYEAVGPKINGNADNFDKHMLVRHGEEVLEVERTFEGIRDFLEKTPIEGIVFHRENGDMCKIRRKDFGFEWPIKQ